MFCYFIVWKTHFHLIPVHIPLRLPGIAFSPTEGEGCRALEPLPAGDQLPRSRRQEVGEDVTTGAKASAWGTTERRQEETATPSSSLATNNKQPCSWWLRLKCLLLHILLCLREWTKIFVNEFNFMFSFEGYDEMKFEEACILTEGAARSRTRTLAVGSVHHESQ